MFKGSCCLLVQYPRELKVKLWEDIGIIQELWYLLKKKLITVTYSSTRSPVPQGLGFGILFHT